MQQPLTERSRATATSLPITSLCSLTTSRTAYGEFSATGGGNLFIPPPCIYFDVVEAPIAAWAKSRGSMMHLELSATRARSEQNSENWSVGAIGFKGGKVQMEGKARSRPRAAKSQERNTARSAPGSSKQGSHWRSYSWLGLPPLLPASCSRELSRSGSNRSPPTARTATALPLRFLRKYEEPRAPPAAPASPATSDPAPLPGGLS